MLQCHGGAQFRFLGESIECQLCLRQEAFGSLLTCIFGEIHIVLDEIASRSRTLVDPRHYLRFLLTTIRAWASLRIAAQSSSVKGLSSPSSPSSRSTSRRS